MIKVIGGLACRICGRTDKHIHVHRAETAAEVEHRTRPDVWKNFERLTDESRGGDPTY